MSSCREYRGRKIKKQDSIEIHSILSFIKFIQAISSGMLGISILGLILVGNNKSAQVVYIMVIIVNMLVIFGGMIPVKYLRNKNS